MVTDNKMSPRGATALKLVRPAALVDGVLTQPVFSVNAGDKKTFDITAFSYRLGGTVYAVGAKSAQTFSAVHATGIGKWLAILIQIDASQVISTKANPNTGDQDYATEALALAALPAPDAGKVAIGVFTLLTTAADWDANTDDLDSADLAAANLLGYQPDPRWWQMLCRDKLAVSRIETFARSLAGTLNASVLVSKQGYTGVVTKPNLEVDRRTVANAAVTKLRFGPFDYLIDGVLYHTDAQKQLAFSAAHVVSADKWGAILLQIDAAGLYSTKVGEATQTTAMAYTTSAEARAALPAPDAGCAPVGVLVIEADGSTWTANTDDIVAGSDLENFDLINGNAEGILGFQPSDSVTLTVDPGEPEDFTCSAFTYAINGVRYAKTASTGLDFSAAHQATASKYLAILVQVDTVGAVSTRVPLVSGRSQTAAQGYDNFADAVAALPNPEANKRPIGYIVVLADAGGWTANTDDLVPGSDLTNVWFVGFRSTQKVLFQSVENTYQNWLFPVRHGAFVANIDTPADVEAADPRPARGYAEGSVALYLAGGSTAAAQAVDVLLGLKPWPLNGEAMAGHIPTGSAS